MKPHYVASVYIKRLKSSNNNIKFCEQILLQNGRCVDSTSKDVRLMKHRAHVLHQQLKGFVQR